MKFFKVIRFDGSDDNVFPRGAEPEEWAVSGAFEFAQIPEDALKGKIRQAFVNGMLGVHSGGRSTFVTVAEFNETDKAAAVEALSAYCVHELGAPDMGAARHVAIEEVNYIAELCSGKPVNTLFAVRRHIDDDGNLREAFHEVKRAPEGEAGHARIWEVVPDDA
ncbi:MAG: DUF6505 family protein [Pseudomonadota bacterium]